jgi:hypothetical protein
MNLMVKDKYSENQFQWKVPYFSYLWGTLVFWHNWETKTINLRVWDMIYKDWKRVCHPHYKKKKKDLQLIKKQVQWGYSLR